MNIRPDIISLLRIYILTLVSDITASNKDVPLISREKGHEFISPKDHDACREKKLFLPNELSWLSLFLQISCLGADLEERRGWGRDRERCAELCMKCLRVGFNIA